MSEDYTWDDWTLTRAQLAQRVAELERQLAQDDSNMVTLAARNAELAAQVEKANADGRDLNRVLDETLTELCDVLEVAIARGEALGYDSDDDYRGRASALRSVYPKAVQS